MGNRNGFTLAEILIVMLITSVLMLGLHAAYRQAHSLWSRAEDDRQAWYLARVLTETLREELCGLYLPPRDGEDEDIDLGAAFQLGSVPGGTVDLRFFTLTPAWHTDVGPSAMARVGYRFSRDQDTGNTSLQRFETLCAGEKLIGTEVPDVLIGNLAEFKVWAFDPNGGAGPESWKESYQSHDRPPKALKVLLKWYAGDRSDPRLQFVEFESVMGVPCEGPLTAPAD
jgi:prepilin-type N-terminal cleavage/methylation domain-containing protein